METVLKKIAAIREARGWTEYQLAERSGLPQSTISSWYPKSMIPSIPSLVKICDAFGITLSQLFADDRDRIDLTNNQKELLDQWAGISKEQQDALLLFLKTM